MEISVHLKTQNTADSRDTVGHLHITAMKQLFALWVVRKGDDPARTKPRCINPRDQARVFAYTHYT
jgi:hypothetical protein